jgi:Tfp pilus assembly protein PilN
MINKMITINLNQTVNKAVLAEMKKEQSRWVVGGVVATLLVISLGLILTLNGSMSSLIEKRELRIDQIITDTKSLKKEGIDLSKTDIESYYDFEINRIFWAEKLQQLSKITPEYMAITKISYDNGRMVISAVSQVNPDEKDFKVIDHFVNLLKNTEEFNKDFAQIKFQNSERIVSRNVEVLTFQVFAKIDQKLIKKMKRKSYS